jgi:hypothetical protein
MAKQPAEQIAEATTEALTKSGEAAEKIVKGSAEALTESGHASRAAIQELTRAYQELAAKNAKNLTAANAVADRSEEPGGVHRIAAAVDQGRGSSCCQR